MEYIPSFLKPASVSRAEFHEAQKQDPDLTVVGALRELFTNHIVSMITATLVCFTAFMGLTRMRTKHAVVLAPVNAIWFTYLFTATSAGTIALGLAGTATAASIASYFFKSHASDAADAAKDVVREGTHSVVDGLKDAAKSYVSPAAVTEELMSRADSKKRAPQSPAMGEATQSVLEQVQAERRTPPPTATTQAPDPVVVPERTDVGRQNHDGVDYDELLRDFEESERGHSRPQTDAVLDTAWRESTAPRTPSDAWASEFLSQNSGAREMVTSIPKEQLHSFDEVWGMVQKQKPGAKMNDPWVQDFISEQCRKKGLPWGKIAKYAGVAAATAAAGYGLYKLYEYWNTPADEERDEVKPKVAKATSKATAVTAQDLAKKVEELPLKQKQRLAMHLLFTQSPAAIAFRGAMKKHVKKTEATEAQAPSKHVEAARTTASNEQPVEKKDAQVSSATRRLEVITGHTSIPVESSREASEEGARPLAKPVKTPMQMDPEALRRLAAIKMYRGRCGVPFQNGFGHPPRMVAKL